MVRSSTSTLRPASTSDSEEQRKIIWDLIGSRGASRPPAPIPLAVPRRTEAASARLSVCWFGHSSALIEVDGYRVLADPVWSRRCSLVADGRPGADARGAGSP